LRRRITQRFSIFTTDKDFAHFARVLPIAPHEM